MSTKKFTRALVAKKGKAGRRAKRARTSGKRSGSETRNASEIIVVRYPMQEYEELKRRVERSGLTLSAYIRQASTGIAQKGKTAKAVTARQKLAGRYLAELGKIGSNLNQLARAANMNQAGAREFEAALKEANAFNKLLRLIVRGDA
jgi:hypothetical protein